MASIIGVNEIQHTNGTEAATINTSGVISRSVVPAWFLTLGTSAESRTSASEAAVQFAVQSDSGYNPTYIQGGASVSNGVVTVPNTGLYYVNGNCRLDSLASGQWGRVAISINGETIFNSANTYQTMRLSPTMLVDVNGETFNGMDVSAVLKLTANDTVEIRASCYSDTAWNISSYDSHFTGYFIG